MSREWWEQIDVSQRECKFFVFRHGACLAPLVCEDLARIDPVQTAIRAVGPNLVVALLMDGPQLENRWSGRYATVLADDPGCSVLSFTSLGLIARQAHRDGGTDSRIALWRQPYDRTKELVLPWGQHALLLRLSEEWSEHILPDGRSDRTTTARYRFKSVLPIRHPSPPSWIDGCMTQK